MNKLYISLLMVTLGAVFVSTPNIAEAQSNATPAPEYLPFDASGGCPVGYNPYYDTVGQLFSSKAPGCYYDSTPQGDFDRGVAADPDASCWKTWTFTSCLWNPFLKGMGTFFLIASAFILLLAGSLFDYFLTLMVLDFGTTFGAVIDAIKIGWTIVRDLMNILIIGTFTFIAVMTILGKHDYGAKRLIANTLIVAILINFSFFFTTTAIGSANFLAKKFWQETGGTVQAGQAAGTAEAFLKAFGLQDYWNQSSVAVEKASKQAGGAYSGFFFGLVGFLVLAGVAYVLFYGAFVISARALLLLFSLLSSSFAFASLMLPAMQRLPFVGWSAWLSNLLRAAAFGPLLAVFLWITMVIIQNAVPNGPVNAGSALASAAIDPSKLSTGSWQQLVLLFMATAMLFLAIKAAGSFANSIGGFSQIKWGLGSSLALSSAAAGIAGRKFIGGYAARRQQDVEKDLSAARQRAGQLSSALDLDKGLNKLRGRELRRREAEVEKANKNVQRLTSSANTLGAISKSKFDFARTDAGQKLLKQLGAGALGKKPESYADRTERIAKEAAKKAGSAALSGEDKTKMRDQYLQQQKLAKEQLETSKKTLEEIRRSPEHKVEQVRVSEAEKNIKDIEQRAEEDIKRIVAAGGSTEQVRQRMTQKEADLQAWTDKITNARKAIKTIEEKSGVLQEFEEAQKRAAGLTNKAIDERMKAVTASSQKASQEAAAKYAAGWYGDVNSVVANKAREIRKKNSANAEKKAIADWLKGDDEKKPSAEKAGGDTKAT